MTKLTSKIFPQANTIIFRFSFIVDHYVQRGRTMTANFLWRRMACEQEHETWEERGLLKYKSVKTIGVLTWLNSATLCSVIHLGKSERCRANWNGKHCILHSCLSPKLHPIFQTLLWVSVQHRAVLHGTRCKPHLHKMGSNRLGVRLTLAY